jgi:hypothetical protein
MKNISLTKFMYKRNIWWLKDKHWCIQQNVHTAEVYVSHFIFKTYLKIKLCQVQTTWCTPSTWGTVTGMAGTAASNQHINYCDFMETSYEFLHISYIQLLTVTHTTDMPSHYNLMAQTPRKACSALALCYSYFHINLWQLQHHCHYTV